MLNIKNKFYSFELDEKEGRIKAFENTNGSLIFGEQPPVLSMRFCGEEDFIWVDVTSAKKCNVESGDNFYRIEYSDFEIADLTAAIEISYSQNDPLLHWNAEVKSYLQLEWLEFPAVIIPDNFADKGGNTRLLWPYNEGMLVDSVAERQKHWVYREPEYPSAGNYGMCPGMVFAPFMAVTADIGGLYIAAHDKEQNTHLVDFCPENDGVRLKLRVYPGIKGGCYKTEYDTVLGVFDGDWHNAAKIYSDWFESNKPQDFIPITKNENLPDWYGESPVIITYCVRGRHDTDIMDPSKLFPYVNALPHIDRLAEKLGSKVMVLLMHWEGTAPWAPPYVWPPYGGEQALKEYIEALHERGHCVGVYCSGLGWTQNSNIADYCMEKVFEEKKLARFMCQPPKNKELRSDICTAQRSGYDMCPSQDFCKDVMVDEVKKMASSGLDYIQLLDQNHGGTPYFCYAEDHGHPPVPGTWASRELRDIMKRIRESVDNKKLLFGCESAAAEAFIPDLLFSDNRYGLNMLFGMPVPLYSFMYHKYINNFMGNHVISCEIVDPKVSKDGVAFRLAHSFIAGDFFTLVINDDGLIQTSWGQKSFEDDTMPNQEETISFTAHLNKWRTGIAKKYLHTGTMVKPLPIVNCPSHKIDVKGVMKPVSPVFTAKYKAEDGTSAQFFANYTGNKVKITVDGIAGKTLFINPDMKNGVVINNTEIEIAPRSAVAVID